MVMSLYLLGKLSFKNRKDRPVYDQLCFYKVSLNALHL